MGKMTNAELLKKVRGGLVAMHRTGATTSDPAAKQIYEDMHALSTRLEAADKEIAELKRADRRFQTVLDVNTRLKERIAELEAGLVDMCCQFAFWSSKGGHWTGGMSALEGAFGLLDWDNPHLAPECCCDEPGCKKQISCGTPSPDGYRNTCWGHKPEASK